MSSSNEHLQKSTLHPPRFIISVQISYNQENISITVLRLIADTNKGDQREEKGKLTCSEMKYPFFLALSPQIITEQSIGFRLRRMENERILSSAVTNSLGFNAIDTRARR
jgi:hypothetical protein